MICNECQHDMAEHRLYGCNAGAEEEEEAEKAILFDALAARITSGAWEVSLGLEGWIVIEVAGLRRGITAPTLAEAVQLAMEAEGER